MWQQLLIPWLDVKPIMHLLLHSFMFSTYVISIGLVYAEWFLCTSSRKYRFQSLKYFFICAIKWTTTKNIVFKYFFGLYSEFKNVFYLSVGDIHYLSSKVQHKKCSYCNVDAKQLEMWWQKDCWWFCKKGVQFWFIRSESFSGLIKGHSVICNSGSLS